MSSEPLLRDFKLQSLYARNQDVVLYIRILGYVAGGSVAGILGLQGVQGFVFYLLVSILITFALLVKTAFAPGRFLNSPMKTILVLGVFQRNSLLTYILFWTLLFSFR